MDETFGGVVNDLISEAQPIDLQTYGQNQINWKEN